MTQYYVLQKVVSTCSKSLKEKYIKDGYRVIAMGSGWNNSIKIIWDVGGTNGK